MQLKDEISNAKKSIEELESAGSATGEGDESEQAKYELLVKRDQDMTAFMEAFPETRNGRSPSLPSSPSSPSSPLSSNHSQAF